MKMNLLFNFVCNLDASVPCQLGFQDPATPMMEGIMDFHNELMFYLVIVIIFTLSMMILCVLKFNESVNTISSSFVHGTLIEIIWTTVPALILLSIAIPSFALLYSMDEIIDPILTLKVVAHQWYWSYEYSDTIDGEDECVLFDSYMITDGNLDAGQFRLLEVDNRVVVPVNTHIRVIITSSDVLHSWAIPSLGVKLDACPGRLNQTSLFIKREGVFYGQCSEICGLNHGFMPIVVEAVSLPNYFKWLIEKI